MSFESLGLRAELLRAVSEQGYSEPTPIQLQAIPAILAGRDLLAGAQTGTGKTAGFSLPLLQRLAATQPAVADKKEKGWRPIRALILTPTRELAAQVRDSVATYGKFLPLRSTAVFGGVNIKPQFQNLRRGVDILVATPGRLEDHMEQRTVDLRAVEVLVLDEADRMLDMGFLPVMKRIMAVLPKHRQNLLFSATVSNEIRTLAQGLLRDHATGSRRPAGHRHPWQQESEPAHARAGGLQGRPGAGAGGHRRGFARPRYRTVAPCGQL